MTVATEVSRCERCGADGIALTVAERRMLLQLAEGRGPSYPERSKTLASLEIRGMISTAFGSRISPFGLDAIAALHRARAEKRPR